MGPHGAAADCDCGQKRGDASDLWLRMDGAARKPLWRFSNPLEGKRLLNAVGGSSLENMTFRGIFVGGLLGFALSFGCASAQTAPSPGPTPSPAASPSPAETPKPVLAAPSPMPPAAAPPRPVASPIAPRGRPAGHGAAACERCAADARPRTDIGRGRSGLADPGGDSPETEKEGPAAPAPVGICSIDGPVAVVSAGYVPRDLQGRRALRGDRAGGWLADRHPGVTSRRHRRAGSEVAEASIDRRRPRSDGAVRGPRRENLERRTDQRGQAVSGAHG